MEYINRVFSYPLAAKSGFIPVICININYLIILKDNKATSDRSGFPI